MPERPIATDVRFYVHFATRTAEGALPHRDLFDNKPQLATIAGATLQLLGRPLGLEPLRAMRLGYLALAALAALLLFAVQRALRGGDCVAGLLGMLCALGFTLLAYLPSIGPVPKLLMAVLALGAALLAYRGRWLLAGLAGGLAALDWQIGALAGLGVLAAALCEPREQRLRASLAVVLGGLAALALFVVYFGARGGLEPAFDQIVASSLARGAAAQRGGERLATLSRILTKMGPGAPGRLWLAWLGVAGMALYPLWLWRAWGSRAARIAIPLAVYGYGIVAFSLVDFQGFGDLMALLQVVAFFAGVAVIEAYTLLRALARSRAGPPPEGGGLAERAVGWIAVAALALAVGLPRAPVEPQLPPSFVPPGATLADQEDVARQLERRIAGRKALFTGCSEQLFLTRRANPVPFVFWNSATHAYFGAGRDETSLETLERILREQDPDVVVCPRPKVRRRLLRSGRFEALELESANRRYRISLVVARR